MSETRPVYIACASGNNAQTDCCIRPHGDLVEILGHSQMHFTLDDAVHFATAILHTATLTGHDAAAQAVDGLRSEIAMALHVPILADSLSRPLLEEAHEVLSALAREARYWQRRALDREAAHEPA